MITLTLCLLFLKVCTCMFPFWVVMNDVTWSPVPFWPSASDMTLFQLTVALSLDTFKSCCLPCPCLGLLFKIHTPHKKQIYPFLCYWYMLYPQLSVGCIHLTVVQRALQARHAGGDEGGLILPDNSDRLLSWPVTTVLSCHLRGRHFVGWHSAQNTRTRGERSRERGSRGETLNAGCSLYATQGTALHRGDLWRWIGGTETCYSSFSSSGEVKLSSPLSIIYLSV